MVTIHSKKIKKHSSPGVSVRHSARDNYPPSSGYEEIKYDDTSQEESKTGK